MKRQAIQKFTKKTPAHASLIDGFASFLHRRNHPERTIETYTHEARIFLAWLGRKHPKSATLADLRNYQEYLAHEYAGRLGKRLSVSSQSRNLSSVRVFFRYLKREGMIFRNPVDKIRLPKVGKRKRKSTFTLPDVRKMIECPAKDASTIRDRALLYFLAATGIRATSCASLDLPDVNLDRREVLVRIGKGNRSYITFFTTGCRVAMEEYIHSARSRLIKAEDNGNVAPLFLGDAGQRLDRSLIRYYLMRLAKRANVRKHIHPHLLRHWLCTTLLERGANIRIVSEVAGHALLSTTTTYAEVTADLLARTVASAHPRGTL